ncbi:MAG: hypothetical protein KY468_09075 [Armatimonadetes bacterium]|nr:hypothetical protein [Armatimonadota bacterium]
MSATGDQNPTGTVNDESNEEIMDERNGRATVDTGPSPVGAADGIGVSGGTRSGLGDTSPTAPSGVITGPMGGQETQADSITGDYGTATGATAGTDSAVLGDTDLAGTAIGAAPTDAGTLAGTERGGDLSDAGGVDVDTGGIGVTDTGTTGPGMSDAGTLGTMGGGPTSGNTETIGSTPSSGGDAGPVRVVREANTDEGTD